MKDRMPTDAKNGSKYVALCDIRNNRRPLRSCGAAAKYCNIIGQPSLSLIYYHSSGADPGRLVGQVNTLMGVYGRVTGLLIRFLVSRTRKNSTDLYTYILVTILPQMEISGNSYGMHIELYNTWDKVGTCIGIEIGFTLGGLKQSGAAVSFSRFCYDC